MDNEYVIVRGKRRYVRWAPEILALIGTMSDGRLAAKLGFTEIAVAKKRKKLGITSYRSTRAALLVPCLTCGKMVHRRESLARRLKPYCSRECASAGQKKRDCERLRYGPGWKAVRKLVRARDKNCRACGTPPGDEALHVHHLKPYRFAGTNHPDNLVALCHPCHVAMERETARILESLNIAVRLDGGILQISARGEVLEQISVLPAEACA